MFISARYYLESGDYGSPDTTAAVNYYGVTAIPTAIFNGHRRVVGGGESVASGDTYQAVLESLSKVPSPIRIRVESLDLTTGDIRAVVTMHSQTDILDNDHIRFLLLEDNLSTATTRATRQILSDTISLAGAGESAVFEQRFDIDPEWNVEELHAVVLVQRQDQQVVQAASSVPPAEYGIRAMVPFDTMTIGPSAGSFVGEDLTVVNVGAATTCTVALMVEQAPPDWVITYADGTGVERTEPTVYELGADGTIDLHTTVTPSSWGSATYRIEVVTPQLEQAIVIAFGFVTDDVEALIVDDDGGETYEQYVVEALTEIGTTYGVWNRDYAKLSADISATFPLLIWNVGYSFPSLDAADRQIVEDHLGAGNSLFLSGQDIGWDLTHSDDNRDPLFYWNVLHAMLIEDDAADHDLDGVDGDPVSDGLHLHIAGGDGADNQDYPSSIIAFDQSATEIFHYQSTGRVGAIRAHDADTDGCLVYLAFGFEGIDNPVDRAALMESSLEWFEQCREPEPSLPPPRQSRRGARLTPSP